MKLAIMQPYFMPYIGYWQLFNAVDKFVLYDNIQFTKKGWFHRNRIIVNNTDKMFTLPLKKDSDYLSVRERFLANDYIKQNDKTLRVIKNSYSKAPYFKIVFPLLEDIFRNDQNNLFDFVFNSIKVINKYLDIDTEIIRSSIIPIDYNNLKGENKVLAIANELKANEYINAIGGIDLYSKDVFKENNIQLQFIKTQNIEYKQLKNEFIPWLSIIDIMMFNSIQEIKEFLKMYKLT